MKAAKRLLNNWGLKPIILAWIIPIFLLTSFFGVVFNYMMAMGNDQKRIEDYILQRRMDLIFLTNLPSLRMYLMDLRLELKEEAQFVEEDVQSYISSYLRNLQPFFPHTLSVASLQGQELLRIENGRKAPVRNDFKPTDFWSGLKGGAFGQKIPLPASYRQASENAFIEDALPIFSEINRMPIGSLVYRYQIPIWHLTQHSHRVLAFNLLLNGAAIVAALIMIYFALGVIIKPLNQLTRSSKKMLAGNLSDPIPLEGLGEARSLAAAFEALRQRLESQIKALQGNARKLEAIIDFLPDATLVIDKDKKVLFWNKAIEDMTGFSRESMVGKGDMEYAVPFYGIKKPVLINIAFDQALEDKVFQNHAGKYQALKQQGNIISASTWCPILRGQKRLLSATASALYDDQGNISGAIECIRDTTEYHEMEQSKEALRAQLLHAQKMEAIGTLAGGIAHDFNNLIQTINGYSELLLRDRKPADLEYEKLSAIQQAAGRAGELTQQLLTFSRKVESRLRPVDVNREIREVKQLLSRTIPKMIEIELHLSSDLKTVNADPTQLEQVLMNLAVNAKDAMPSGGKLIVSTENVVLDEQYCRLHAAAKPGAYVLLAVSDTGHGMDSDTMSHIFEPFFTTKGIGKGTGLGLAIVYGIVENHGGSILCASEPGGGTRFEIRLPAIEQWCEPADFGQAVVAVKGGDETVLVVDDEWSIRELSKEILASVGYQVLLAPDGETALEIYQKQKHGIDLIVLDLGMPGIGGSKCLQEILKINSHAKVLIASGYFGNRHAKENLESGASGLISKPYHVNQLLMAVREILDQNGHCNT